MLSAKQIETFQRNGYLFLDNIIPQDTLTGFASERCCFYRLNR